MNALIVDTSSWISYFRGDGHPDIDQALADSRLWLPPLVAAELLSGVLKPLERRNLIELLRELPLCDTGFDHWARVGNLRSQLLKKGAKVSTPDAHIAQCTLDLNGLVLSEDKIFRRIAELTALRLYPTH